VATDNGYGETPLAGGDQPPMPSVPPSQLWRGAPYLLAEGRRHAVGWQDSRRAGPSFVVTTRKLGGFRTAVQRFPLSEQGWADAWEVLSRLDASAAETTRARLAKLDAGRRAEAARDTLDAQSLCYLRSVAFDGGSHSGSLTKGNHYDLRFQADRILVLAPYTAQPIVELPYADVDAVEVSEPATQPTSVALGWICGLGLVGALLGLLVLGVLGLLLGAVVFGLVGGLIAAGASKHGTIVRVRGRDVEWQFLDSAGTPDDFRRALAEPLLTIRQSHAASSDRSDEYAEPVSDSAADELSKLASLLQQDLITREEFERLKARTIARQ
jgi:hypothetical protein